MSEIFSLNMEHRLDLVFLGKNPSLRTPTVNAAEEETDRSGQKEGDVETNQKRRGRREENEDAKVSVRPKVGDVKARIRTTLDLEDDVERHQIMKMLLLENVDPVKTNPTG